MGDVGNIIKHKVSIVLDRPRTLFYSMKGFIYLADKYGDAQAAFKKIPKESGKVTAEGLTALVDLIYAGLVHEDKTITPDDVASMVDIQELANISGKINEALTENTPKVDAADPT